MPIFKTNKTAYSIHAIYEDIRPSGNRLYVWGEAFTEDTLEYCINDGLNHSIQKNTLTGRGQPSMSYSAHYYDGVLFLANGAVHVNHAVWGSTNDERNNLEFDQYLSMDPTNPCRNHRYVTWNDLNAIVNIYQHMWQNNVTTSVLWETFFNVPPSQTLDKSTIAQQGSDNYRHLWMYNIRPATGFIQMVTQWSATPRNNWPTNWGPGRIANWYGAVPNASSNFTYTAPTQYSDVMIQRIGNASNGEGLFILNGLSNDHNHTIIRYNDVSNSITTLQTITSAPYPSAGASGASSTSSGWLLPGTTTTNMGGTRVTTTTGTNLKICSQTFIDPTTSTGRAWYTPFFDLGSTYQPFYYQWNTTTDFFTRSNDVIVDWRGTGTQWLATATQWHFFRPDNVSAGSFQTTYGMQRPWVNETFTVTSGTTSTRYLTLMQLHGSGSAYDNDHLYRTFVTFKVDAVNPKFLVRHSQVIIPYTPKNIIWLSDDKLLLGVFGYNFFNIYTFYESTGWTQTASLPYRFDAVGRDSMGRIWAVDPGPFWYGRLHLISASLPTTLAINLVASDYNYTGTNIITTATVNAFDTYGMRIACNVDLAIEGTSMRFVNTLSQQVTSLTTTTSETQDTNVSVVIVGSGDGFINGSIRI